jgi:hypothetical protein
MAVRVVVMACFYHRDANSIDHDLIRNREPPFGIMV